MPELAHPSKVSQSIWLPQIAVIKQIRPEVEDVATFFMELKHRAPIFYAPGQFNMLYVPGCGEVAISISGHAEENRVLQHTIRYVGRVTHALADLKEGSELGLRGPYGNPWPIQQYYGRDVAIVAGGLGLAPLKPVIEAIVQKRGEFRKVHLFIGARSPELILFSYEHTRWIEAGIDVQVIVDRDIQHLGYTTVVVPLLIDRTYFSDPRHTVAFVCGPEIMMEYSARSLLKKRLESNSIYVSLERNMQCAVGFCGHCQLGSHFLCKDGPVLAYDRVQASLLVRDL
jgi:NAD(P)H-flavin reductase